MRIDGKFSSGSEVLIGTEQDDQIYPLGGSDFIDGRGGFDSLAVLSPSTNFRITTFEGTTYLDAISGASSADRVSLRHIEQLVFSDQTLSLEIPDTFTDTTAPDRFDGGPGLDRVIYQNTLANYGIQAQAGGLSVTPNPSASGSDWLLDVERLVFSDLSLAFDADGAAGTTLRILGAVFGPDATHNPSYVGIGIDALDRHLYDETSLMVLALQARLDPSWQDAALLVDLLYTNVVGQSPTTTERDFYVGLLDQGSYSPTTLALMAAHTSLNEIHVGLLATPFEGVAYLLPVPS